jgi:adenylosuccinate synthase
VITPFDTIFNCLIETERGGHRHGSCGAGLCEAVCRAEAGYPLPLGSFVRRDKALAALLADVRDIYYDKRLRDSGFMLHEENPWYEVWHADGLIPNYLAEVRKLQQHVTLVSAKNVLNSYKNQVYEGAQGLLLDWDNEEYMPNLTASYTGLKNVVSLFKLLEDKNLDAEVCYVTRTYLTRHGAGRFDTEVPKNVLGDHLVDKTNIFNRWQGDLRWGYFDPELFEKTIEKDILNFRKLPMRKIGRSIAFTHADTTSGCLLTRAGNIPIENYIKRFSSMDLNNYYVSTGERPKAVIKHRITE